MEMNLHAPQSYSSSVELQELAAVPYQIISPANNQALISLVQDTLLGYHVITGDDIFLDKRDMMNILMGVPNFDGVLPEPIKIEDKKEFWSGRQLISLALPNINIKTKGIVVKNGQLIEGQIKKGSSNAITQVIYNDFGPKVCQQYLDNIQNIITRFLIKHGFSIGVSDLVIGSDLRHKIREMVTEGKKEVLQLERKIHLNILTDIGRSVQETYESKSMGILNKTTEQIDKMYKKELKPGNRAITMMTAGSKGKEMNIRQMSTHLGQQIVQGKRVPIGYTDRTLPHYYRYDSDVISRGFVENSFTDGLTAQECFFHAMGGREGLIDTAVKSVSGDTEIIIIEDNTPKHIKIGDWIDNKLEFNTKNIEYTSTNNLELLHLTNNVVIPTMDYHGNVSWGEVTAVTRHDPGNVLYQIKTLAGKSVIVTEAKSLLIWNESLNQFKEVLTPEIKVGDHVPVTANLPEPPVIKDLTELQQVEDLIVAPKDKVLDLISVVTHMDTKLENIINMVQARHNNIKSEAKRLNDIVFDKIVEIKELSPDNYPKMYDLTIPDTYNFGLANGLQVRDTAESGYIQRKLIKAMEDLKVYHDNAVRSATGDIVQFLYGYDGIDASGNIEGNVMDLAIDEYSTLKASYQFSKTENWSLFLTKSAISRMKKTTDWFKKLDNYFQDLMERREKLYKIFNYTMDNNMENIQCPFNVDRVINNTLQTYKIGDNQLSDLSPVEVIDMVDELCQELKINEMTNFNFELVVRCYFSPKKVTQKYRLTKLALTHALSVIRFRFKSAKVQAGEMVGLLSAQSLGEISTQLTLNTFHSSGSGATITTKGVPRLRELLSNTRNMSTPSATIFLDEDSKYSLERALEVKYNIEITTIRDIALSCSIYNDPDNKFKSVIDEDKSVMDIYKVFHEIDENCREMKSNPWVMRFKFDRSKMMARNISMDNIYQVITQSYNNAVCIYSDDNSNDLIFRIRLDFQSSTEKADDDIKYLKKVESKILDLVVKGIDGIDGSNISNYNISLVKDVNGNYITKSERILTTDGSNLIDLMNINHVDFTRCYCNDINEINTLFGIEAARATLLREFYAIFGGDINYRHVAMLCDIMTSQGNVMSVDRHGINRGKNGPLAKCSFEEAVDQLQKASIHGDTDNMKGVSANVMMGQIPPCGTGDSILLLDEYKLKETQEIDTSEEKVNYDELMSISNYCEDNVGIKYNINKKKKKINVKNIPKVIPE